MSLMTSIRSERGKTRMRTTRISWALLLIPVLTSVACIRLHGPKDLRRELSESAGVRLEREVGFTVTRSGVWLARMGLSMADETPVSLKGVKRVQVGIYKVDGLARGHDKQSPLEVANLLPGWEPAVAVRRVDDDDVDPRAGESGGALGAIRADSDRRPATQPTVIILDRGGEAVGLEQVLDRDQARQRSILADDEELFDPMLVKQRSRTLLRHARRNGHELFGHQGLDALREVPLETDVPAGEDPDWAIVLHHGQPRDLVLPHDLGGLHERLLRSHRDRVEDHPALRPLHLRHLAPLILGAEVLVDDPEAALPGHRHRGPPLRDGVHRARQDRDVQRKLARQTRAHVRTARKEVREAGYQKDVIERQGRFETLFDHEGPVIGAGV